MHSAPARAPILTPSLSAETGADHARRLFESLGISPTGTSGWEEEDPLLVWARSGAMYLTGQRCPEAITAPLATAARGAFLALRALAPSVQFDLPYPERLLSERASAAGFTRAGARSCGGSCHLLPTRDGIIALNLARAQDWEQLPALLCNKPPATAIAPGDWDSLRDNIALQQTAPLLDLGQTLGLAIADAAEPLPERHWCLKHAQTTATAALRQPLIVDLSALWAGPLCASLLGATGARVIKVESSNRPDGARSGPESFFALMNSHKASLTLALDTQTGRRQLAALIERADIVIESSRPRALRQMGIQAEAVCARHPGKIWVSITGYGREHELAIAYGDDAGVAAGLSRHLFEITGRYLFCGDAIADPLTGLHAAVAAYAHWLQGKGGVLDISLSAVTAFCSHPRPPLPADLKIFQSADDWVMTLNNTRYRIIPPQHRDERVRAPALGSDNAAIFKEFSLPC